jgi:hypothetical protein
MKEKILAGALALGSMIPGMVKAEEPTIPTGAVEMKATTSGVELDAQMSTGVGKFGLFQRNFVTIDWKGNPGNFGLFDLTYNLGDHGDAVFEGQYSIGTEEEPGFFMPRLGFQAYGEVADMSLYGLATVEADGDLESGSLVELLGTVSGSRDLGKVNRYIDAEFLLDLGLDGPSYAHQEGRIGFGDDIFQAGVSGKVKEINVDGVTVVEGEVGPYAQVSF